MNISYSPSEDEIENAIAKLELWLKKEEFPDFKIGRVDAENFLTLKNRDEYFDARKIYILFEGSKGKCEAMEKILIDYSWKNYSDLCINDQYGGGPQGEGNYHIVYLVVW